ncbi:MAG: nucleotide exchange factor GrpE [Betaproteobacteria bacterium]|nr:nucleotide exchange factor GrpE [Betaproteobacteria bacterium]
MSETPNGAAEAVVPPPSSEAGDASPEGQLTAARAEIERLKEDFLRAKAETENIRRRAADDVTRAHKFALEGFAGTLLPVRDSLEAALAIEAPTAESLREGVAITGRQLAAAFEKAALAEIAPAGHRFDPHLHQAISQVESDEPPGTVVAVVQKGYRLHDRVIRPALVVVARERSAAAPEAPPAA